MKITWDKSGEHFYETGVDNGVLYPTTTTDTGITYGTGVAWNGLTSVSESPSGAEPSAFYADNIKYLNIMSVEEFAATIEAYTYPDEFAECDGTAALGTGVTIGQQTRKAFGLCYRTKVGNDIEGSDLGYKIHIVYGCLAKPSSRDYATINDSPEPITFSWEISTTPVDVDGFKPTATLEIDSTKTDADKLKTIEEKLYGTADTEPTLLMPSDILAILNDTEAQG